MLSGTDSPRGKLWGSFGPDGIPLAAGKADAAKKDIALFGWTFSASVVLENKDLTGLLRIRTSAIPCLLFGGFLIEGFHTHSTAELTPLKGGGFEPPTMRPVYGTLAVLPGIPNG